MLTTRAAMKRFAPSLLLMVVVPLSGCGRLATFDQDTDHEGSSELRKAAAEDPFPSAAQAGVNSKVEPESAD